MIEGLSGRDRELFDRFKVWKHRPDKQVSDGDGPSPQQTYEQWMKEAFGPLLRDEGLRGSGGRYALPSETVWALLGFQKSAYSDRREVRFTVNLSAIPRDVWLAESAARPYLGQRPTPNTTYGSWADQVRIGQLTPAGEDKWWRIPIGPARAEVRDDVERHLREYAVPWLRERAN